MIEVANWIRRWSEKRDIENALQLSNQKRMRNYGSKRDKFNSKKKVVLLVLETVKDDWKKLPNIIISAKRLASFQHILDI